MLRASILMLQVFADIDPPIRSCEEFTRRVAEQPSRKDPWGNQLEYRCLRKPGYYEVRSYGPDRKRGTCDDVTDVVSPGTYMVQ